MVKKAEAAGLTVGEYLKPHQGFLDQHPELAKRLSQSWDEFIASPYGRELTAFCRRTLQEARDFTGQSDGFVAVEMMQGECGQPASNLGPGFWALLQQAKGARRGNTEAMRAALTAAAPTAVKHRLHDGGARLEWWGDTLEFDTPSQCAVVKFLYGKFVDGNPDQSQKAIREAIQSNDSDFRMAKCFEGNRAFGSVIQKKPGKSAIFRLVPGQ